MSQMSSVCMMVPVAAAAPGGMVLQPIQMASMYPVVSLPEGFQMSSGQSVAATDCAQWAQSNGHTGMFGQQAWPQATTNATTNGMELVQGCQGWVWAPVPMMSASPCTDFNGSHCNNTWTTTRNTTSWFKGKAPKGASFDAEAEAYRQRLSWIQTEAASDAEAEDRMVKGLLSELNCGEEPSQTAMKQFRELAFFSTISSRAAQTLLSMSDISDQKKAGLALSLVGHLWYGRCAVDHPHANHVVQKIVEVLPASRREFIVEELLGVVHKAAKRKIACRTLCRILEHLSSSRPMDGKLVAELMFNVGELCRDAYGGYVVRQFLEHADEFPVQKHHVAVALSKDAAWYAKRQMSSFVMEAALAHCEPEDQRSIAAGLLSDKECLKICNTSGGAHVFEALLQSRATKKETSHALERVARQLPGTPFGKKLLKLLVERRPWRQ